MQSRIIVKVQESKSHSRFIAICKLIWKSPFCIFIKSPFFFFLTLLKKKNFLLSFLLLVTWGWFTHAIWYNIHDTLQFANYFERAPSAYSSNLFFFCFYSTFEKEKPFTIYLYFIDCLVRPSFHFFPLLSPFSPSLSPSIFTAI